MRASLDYHMFDAELEHDPSYRAPVTKWVSAVWAAKLLN